MFFKLTNHDEITNQNRTKVKFIPLQTKRAMENHFPIFLYTIMYV